MSMPEAAVHENARSVFPQYQVWMSWQPLMIEPVSESPTPQSLAHNHFRLRILRPDRRHVVVPLLRREFIHNILIDQMYYFINQSNTDMICLVFPSLMTSRFAVIATSVKWLQRNSSDALTSDDVSRS